jgi:transposase
VTVQAPHVTAAERADRNRRIAEARAMTGLTWPEVAARFGVSERTARRAARAHAQGSARLRSADSTPEVPSAGELLAARPEDVLATALRHFEWLLAGLQREAAEGDNSSSRVGAYNAYGRMLEKQLVLLQAVGQLPVELGALRHLLDLRETARRMLDAMDAFEREVGAVEVLEVRRAAERVRGTFNELLGIEERPALEAAA